MLGNASSTYLVINGSAKTFDAIVRPLTSHRRWTRPTFTRMSHRFVLVHHLLDPIPFFSRLLSRLFLPVSISVPVSFD